MQLCNSAKAMFLNIFFRKGLKPGIKSAASKRLNVFGLLSLIQAINIP